MRKNKGTGKDWIIHIVRDGVPCDACGESKDDVFIPGMCDAHTHGLDKIGSRELQFVLGYPDDAIGYILNEIARRISFGLYVPDGGTTIRHFFHDGAPVRLDEGVDSEGVPIWRVVIPDGDWKWPEESEEYPYMLQVSSPYRNAYDVLPEVVQEKIRELEESEV